MVSAAPRFTFPSTPFPARHSRPALSLARGCLVAVAVFGAAAPSFAQSAGSDPTAVPSVAEPSCGGGGHCGSSRLAGTPVEVKQVRSRLCRGRLCQSQKYVVRMLVTNVAYEKEVEADLVLSNPGRYVAEPAHFVASLPGNKELWEATLTTPAGADDCPSEIGLLYGRIRAGDGAFVTEPSGPVRGCGFFATDPVALDRNPSRRAFDYGLVQVQDLAYEKKVTVVYSTDGWATTQTKAAHFERGTNANGFQEWRFDFTAEELAAPHLAYAIAYEVAGNTYWDNNFGRNYTNDDLPLP
jgi:hypothetical protein